MGEKKKRRSIEIPTEAINQFFRVFIPISVFELDGESFPKPAPPPPIYTHIHQDEGIWKVHLDAGSRKKNIPA